MEDNIENLIVSLEEACNALFDWLKSNPLQSNPDKCHALVSTERHLNIKIVDHAIASNKCKTMRCVKTDVNLNFNNHMSDLRKKASRKIFTC